ncbi:MAG: peptidoglycan editing factor PgeF [Candidatus Latescibacteria bacterium]|nr:peptidoglycan editing factor PgeF [Candidatus Latescibacterota bacterium]NIM21699.1 peptidoglycan editing factor PgeF [Candidatus Latescibacterota bacterium]NIM65726.1 peptidoglycan editing factor PgeF [Candidatus Latescibacterota bacterium]NIO02111.1 peptidoglycan editing factor PgeF [Candidatus Latescibacterota bacterium]NIO28928.1 peptidoglycan editing factor PgeF [Candidatus Latescibacterota bacterium]
MSDEHYETIRPFIYRNWSIHNDVMHIVTSRQGGVSEEPYHSLNLGFHVGDDTDAVLENRMRVCRAVGVDPGALTTAEQVHGSYVAVVGKTDRGRGAQGAANRLPKTDAMVTNTPNIPLMVLVADCAVIGLYDPIRKAIGVAHAGWRGTAAGVARRAVEKMKEVFGSNPADLIAGISPSIGPCCYEVGDGVCRAFQGAFPETVERFFTKSKKGKAHLNLWEANKWQLEEAGLKRADIEAAELCTACHTDLFFSHRAENGKTGRFGGLMMLRGSQRR